MSRPTRPGWYPDPLKPETQERRWDGTEWTDETREASEATRASAASGASEAPVVEEVAQQPSRDQVTEAETEPEPDEESEAKPWSRGATTALVAAIVVLVAALILQVLYLWGPLKDDPTISSDRPVLLSEAATKSAVETAAQAAEAFSARSYKTYDDQVDAAADMMTTTYAKEFRATTDEVRDAFIANETEVTVTVEAQGVMTASENQVEALVFLTQYTKKKGEEGTGVTPFRIKVTVIDTDQGWLVSKVDTA